MHFNHHNTPLRILVKPLSLNHVLFQGVWRSPFKRSCLKLLELTILLFHSFYQSMAVPVMLVWLPNLMCALFLKQLALFPCQAAMLGPPPKTKVAALEVPSLTRLIWPWHQSQFVVEQLKHSLTQSITNHYCKLFGPLVLSPDPTTRPPPNPQPFIICHQQAEATWHPTWAIVFSLWTITSNLSPKLPKFSPWLPRKASTTLTWLWMFSTQQSNQPNPCAKKPVSQQISQSLQLVAVVLPMPLEVEIGLPHHVWHPPHSAKFPFSRLPILPQTNKTTWWCLVAWAVVPTSSSLVLLANGQVHILM